MSSRVRGSTLDKSAGPLRRALQYAYYDWSREMPRSKRVVLWAGHLMQGYAIYSLWVRSLAWPIMWPHGPFLYGSIWLLYLVGAGLKNGMLTSEFVRKTQMEADQVAARQIQQTLIPQTLPEIRGYQVESFYKPLREVGGDYFDVIELSEERTLFALADVSGKGMPAALLAANIQALVRSMSAEAAPLTLALRINKHLSRYTPSDRFATAVFVVLNHYSGELTYVNAGHNAPLLNGESQAELQPTGMPLGLFPYAAYETGTASLSPGGALLLFTDGLTDSITGGNAEERLRDALVENSGSTMSRLKSLVDAKFNEDDITILLVKRSADATSRTYHTPGTSR